MKWSATTSRQAVTFKFCSVGTKEPTVVNHHQQPEPWVQGRTVLFTPAVDWQIHLAVNELRLPSNQLEAFWPFSEVRGQPPLTKCLLLFGWSSVNPKDDFVGNLKTWPEGGVWPAHCYHRLPVLNVLTCVVKFVNYDYLCLCVGPANCPGWTPPLALWQRG